MRQPKYRLGDEVTFSLTVTASTPPVKTTIPYPGAIVGVRYDPTTAGVLEYIYQIVLVGYPEYPISVVEGEVVADWETKRNLQ